MLQTETLPSRFTVGMRRPPDSAVLHEVDTMTLNEALGTAELLLYIPGDGAAVYPRSTKGVAVIALNDRACYAPASLDLVRRWLAAQPKPRTALKATPFPPDREKRETTACEEVFAFGMMLRVIAIGDSTDVFTEIVGRFREEGAVWLRTWGRMADEPDQRQFPALTDGQRELWLRRHAAQHQAWLESQVK